MGAIEATQAARTARGAAPFETSVWALVAGLFDRHPDTIFFGGGVPAQELIPIDRLREGARLAWEDPAAALDYGETEGYAPLRRWIAERMGRRGAGVASDEIVLTNGSQQGIDVVARALLDPGDVALVEAPTFMDALRVFRSREATVVGVPMDEEGIRVDALARIVRGLPAPPKLLYTIPSYQNPTGISTSRPRRKALVRLARAEGLTLVEDDPYGELRYGGEELPPLRGFDPAVVYLGTFSKTVAPGLRVGWMTAQEPLRSTLFAIKEGTDIQNERIMTRTLFHAVDGFLDAHLANARDVYRRRRDAMLASLDREMPAGVSWTVPAGGFFVWVRLPNRLDADRLLPPAAERGVIFLPGSWFYPDREVSDELRLNFSTLPEERIVEGVRRLGSVIRAALADPDDHPARRESAANE